MIRSEGIEVKGPDVPPPEAMSLNDAFYSTTTQATFKSPLATNWTSSIFYCP